MLLSPPPAPKVTLEQINHILDDAEIEETIFFDKVLVCCYRLYNGFTIVVDGPVITPELFDIETGRAVCRKKAVDKLYLLEGYLLQNQIFENENEA